MNTAEMTPSEYQAATKKLARSIGPEAQIWTYLNTSDGPLFNASVYSRGVGRADSEFSVTGESLGELNRSLAKKWAEYGEAHRARTIRKMALAIIRITAELGECTDAALRNCGEFDHSQIKAYGDQACRDANEIAGKGPFSIVVKGGANAKALSFSGPERNTQEGI